MFTEINYAFYQVADLHRAERFYREVLGMEVTKDPQNPVSVAHLGAQKIGLHGFSGHVEMGTANAVVTLLTDWPIEKVRDALAERGVMFWGDISQVTGGQFFGFLDSEGNRLGVFQSTKARRSGE